MIGNIIRNTIQGAIGGAVMGATHGRMGGGFGCAQQAAAGMLGALGGGSCCNPLMMNAGLSSLSMPAMRHPGAALMQSALLGSAGNLGFIKF